METLMELLNEEIFFFGQCRLELLFAVCESVMQTLLVEIGDDKHELEEVKRLKKRLQDFANEANSVIDSEGIRSMYGGRPNGSPVPSNHTLNGLVRSIMFIKKDLNSILNKMETESSTRTDSMKTKSAAATEISSSRNSLRSDKVWDDIVVGLDHDIELIRDKLTEDTRKLDIISIVGMGGLGKTTLAAQVYNDRFVSYRFYVRGWVTVSQTYEKTDLLYQILASIGVKVEPDKRDNYSHLREKLHKCFMDQRYLVVIDDIWNTDAWDVLKVVFPDNNNGSRLLLTSRDKRVALHAKEHGLVHQLRCLTDEESWELLRKKVFYGDDFPDSLSETGMQIAKNCRGLPLALVVTAGILAKESLTRDAWKRVSQSGGLLIIKGNMEMLALSLNHLPSHLRECFLYLGGFPEDHRFGVKRLIWLWIAEGFIQEAENQSVEETAKDYLMELVDRNLVIVQNSKFDRNFDGSIKTISVHDVLRELCLEAATKERFRMEELLDNCIIAPCKTSRIFIRHDTERHMRFPFKGFSNERFIIHKCTYSWRLLTVLDLKQCRLIYFPEEISLLVNLRYLAIYDDKRDFQSTICHLLSLQFLIYNTSSDNLMMLPNTVSNLVNLRHWRCPRSIIFPPLQMPLMNLQSISNVVLRNGAKSLVKYFPVVKNLSCFIYLDRKYNFKPLGFLEMLKIRSMKSSGIRKFQNDIIQFPTSLKKLTLQGCRLPWSYMSIIQALPYLEVLKLLKDAFVGDRWDTGEEPFQQLTLLMLIGLDIQKWEASSFNFPCLKQLFLDSCVSLERIPLEMGYIPALERINIIWCGSSLIESAYEIQEEQRVDGNYDLKIRHDGSSRRVDMMKPNWSHDVFDDVELPTPRELEELGLPINEIREEQCADGNYDIWDLVEYISYNHEFRTSTSIQLLTPRELQELGLKNNDPPVIPADDHIRRSRRWNNGRSRHRPTKRKILRGGERIKLLQY